MARDQGLEIQYKGARDSFEQGKFAEAADTLNGLLARILGKIIKENHIYLSSSDDYAEAVASIGETSDVLEWDLGRLAELFDRVDIFTHCREGDLKRSADLLRSFRYRQLAFLCDSVKDGTWDDLLKKLSVQQVLAAGLALLNALDEIDVRGVHFLVNTQELRRFISAAQDEKEQIESLETYTEYLLDEKIATGIGSKIFDVIKVRGMLINREDNSRNISFKVETLVRILTTIHDQAMKELRTSGMEELVAAGHAQWILFSAGYTSGWAFGGSLHEIFRKDISQKTLRQKIDRWCFFDSDVGFGLFAAEEVVEETDVLRVVIRLSDNFLVHGKSAEDANLCSFMCGYIQGILERVTRLPLVIRHSKRECEQYSPTLRSCIFKLERDEERFGKFLSVAGDDEQVWGGDTAFTPPTVAKKRERIPARDEEGFDENGPQGNPEGDAEASQESEGS